MIITKVTRGCIEQKFDTELNPILCIEQKFYVTGKVIFNDEDGFQMELREHFDQLNFPFDLIQPKDI